MRISPCRMAMLLLAAGVTTAGAAPLVPPGDLPGRERERFTPSPLDRFMQPSRPAEPLIEWDCRDRTKPRRGKRGRNC